MKKLALALLAPLALNAHAATKGFFLGADLGEKNSHFSASKMGVTSADPRNYGVAGRLLAGYQYNQYIGFEAAYMKLHNARILNINGIGTNGNISEYMVDLLIDAFWPFANGYFLQGQIGGGYLSAKPDGALQALSTNDYAGSKVAHFRPVFGLGAGYSFNDQFSIAAKWMHVLEHRALPEVNFIALNFTYHFA